MRNIVEGNHSRLEFDSIADLRETISAHYRHADVIRHMHRRPEWFGDVGSHEELFRLARVGWNEKTQDTLDVSEDVLEQVSREYALPTFQSFYDVSGVDVDVARYLSGEPENMISYELLHTPDSGRVVALAANLAVGHSVTSEAMISRGQAVVALAYALEMIGIRTELYADFQVRGKPGTGMSSRTVVTLKSAEDALDPAMVMFAYAHPAFFRALALPAMHAHPRMFHEPLKIGSSYGRVTETLPLDVFPEECIYVPSFLKGNEDTVTDAREFVIEHLKSLRIIE